VIRNRAYCIIYIASFFDNREAIADKPMIICHALVYKQQLDTVRRKVFAR